MFGAIAGDIIGSRFEFSNCKSKIFDLFNEDSTFTDDTVCTIAILDAIFNKKDPAKTLAKWCRNYPKLSYGDSFRKWIDSDELLPYNSFGNGAAMRVSSVGWLANSTQECKDLCDEVTKITHNHKEGMIGAQAVVNSIYMTRLNVYDFKSIRERIQLGFGYDLSKTVDQIREDYRFDESCQGTVPQALTCCFEATSFEDAIRNAVSIGGDSDTIAAITGSVAEARWGVPNTIRSEIWSRLPQDMKEIIGLVYSTKDWK